MVKMVIYAVGASRKVGRTYTELVIRVGVTSIEKDKEKCGRVGQPLLGCQWGEGWGGEGGEENRGPPLHVGNKTPVWSTARPILVPEIMKLCDPP